MIIQSALKLPRRASAEELISRFTFKETGAEVEAFDSSQDNIDKRTQIIEVGGVKTALLSQTDARQHGGCQDALQCGQQ